MKNSTNRGPSVKARQLNPMKAGTPTSNKLGIGGNGSHGKATPGPSGKFLGEGVNPTGFATLNEGRAKT